jgi:hypothetical protein
LHLKKSIVGEVKLPNIDEQWLRPQTLVHNRENFTKVIGQKTKFSRVKNSALPAVEAPHPGRLSETSKLIGRA